MKRRFTILLSLTICFSTIAGTGTGMLVYGEDWDQALLEQPAEGDSDQFPDSCFEETDPGYEDEFLTGSAEDIEIEEDSLNESGPEEYLDPSKDLFDEELTDDVEEPLDDIISDPESILQAADSTTKPITEELHKYPFDVDCLLFTPSSTGIYHFVYYGLSNIAFAGDNEGDSVTSQEFPSGNNSLLGTESTLIAVKLNAGVEYEITARVSGECFLYFYKAPDFCVRAEKKPDASGNEPSDYHKVIRYYNKDGDPSELPASELVLIGMDQKDDMYFITLMAEDDQNSENEPGVVFLDPFRSKIGHVWCSEDVISAATCSEAGLKRCTCLCGAIDDLTIPKIAHEWSAYDENGDRTCSVCKTKQHDSSKVRKKEPVYEISGKPAGLKVKAMGSRKLKVSWKKPAKSKLKKIKGYYIQVATDRNFTNIVKTKTVKKKKTTFTFKKLKEKQRYYVRIRFCNGARISRWSTVKGRKVK